MTQKYETLIQLNLQFFAKDGPGGEKTEQPTAKKLNDARKRGQVAKSKEIASALGLFSFFIVLKLYVGSIGSNFIMGFHAVYSGGSYYHISAQYDAAAWPDCNTCFTGWVWGGICK